MSTPEENSIHVDLPPIDISAEEANAFLVDLFGLWESGKVALEAGYKATPEAWQKIIERHNQYAAMLVIKAMKAVSGPLYSAAASRAFADGAKQAQARRRSAPAMPAKLPALDSEAIVKTIGEELRKMFDAGLVQGKATADNPAGAAGALVKLEKPSGEIVRVQRNGAGEIVGAVKQLVYDGSSVV